MTIPDVNHKPIRKKISHLVLFAFVGLRPSGCEVCHGTQGAKIDSLDNLSWGTHAKNQGTDRLRDGTDNRGEKHGMSKLNSRQVRIIKRCFKLRVNGCDIARFFRVSPATISSIKHLKRWSHIIP